MSEIYTGKERRQKGKTIHSSTVFQGVTQGKTGGNSKEQTNPKQGKRIVEVLGNHGI